MTRTGRALAAPLFALYIVQCLYYIASTSFVEDHQRYFTLWDDAMISMQYARNLALGNGLVWVAGEEAVQGFTNLGTTLVMAVLHLIPGPRETTALFFQLVNLGCLLGIAVYSYRLALLLFDNRWVARGTMGVTALYGPLNIWSLQGSDAGLLALVLLVALVGLVRSRNAGLPTPLRVYGLLAIGVVIRQDFSLVVGLVIAYEFLTARGADRWKRAVPGGLSLVLVWAGLLLFGQWYYGDPLPNTYYLKATGNPRDLVLMSGLSQLGDVFSGRGLIVLGLLAGYASFLLRHERRDLFVLLLALIAAFHAYYVWVGGDWVVSHTSRYLVAVMPLWIVLLCGGAWRLSEWLREREFPQALAAFVFVAQLLAVAFSLNPAASVSEWHLRSVEPMYLEQNQDNVRFARSICRYTTPDTTIGLFWAGVPSYFCDRSYVDLLGRADRHIAKLKVDHFRGPGHAKWDWDYILNERKLDVIAVWVPELQDRRDFYRQYCIARMPHADLSLPIRKESKDKLLDRDLRLCGTVPFPPCQTCKL